MAKYVHRARVLQWRHVIRELSGFNCHIRQRETKQQRRLPNVLSTPQQTKYCFLCKFYLTTTCCYSSPSLPLPLPPPFSTSSGSTLLPNRAAQGPNHQNLFKTHAITGWSEWSLLETEEGRWKVGMATQFYSCNITVGKMLY